MYWSGLKIMNYLTQREKEIQRTLEKVNSIENMVDRPMYNIHKPEEVKVEIKVDNKVANGLFVPSKVIENLWYANEQTYRAMKKDLFATGTNIDELVEAYQCHSCKTDLDKQFWHFCPYCGQSFLE